MALIEFPKKKGKGKVYPQQMPLAIEPEVVEVLPPTPPPPEPVVHADNRSVSNRNAKFFWVVMQVPVLILTLATYASLHELFSRMGESQPEFFAGVAAAMVAVAGLVAMTYVTLLVSSGDFTAIREIKQRYLTQRHRDKLTASYQMEKLAVIERHNDQQHEQEMARIEAARRAQKLQEEIKHLQYKLSMKQGIVEAHVADLPDRQTQQRAAQAVNSLAAKVDRYFFGLGGVYEADGAVSAEVVEANGYFKSAVPWSTRGRGPAGWTPGDGQEFAALMTQLEEALGAPLVLQHPGSRRWMLNESDYPDREDARLALEQVLS